MCWLVRIAHLHIFTYDTHSYVCIVPLTHEIGGESAS